jgi:hypothetical protein
MQHAADARHETQLFISVKTTTAIPTRCSLVRDALIQATLDPAVRAIEFIPSARVGKKEVALDAVVIVRDDGRFLLDVVPARPLRNVEDEGLVLLAADALGLRTWTLTECDIRREPRFENARLVWGYRMAPVGIEMRMRILTMLRDDGPMSLGYLLQQLRGPRDPGRAVMALACSDLLELDLDMGPLGPSTTVRCRS